MATGREGLDELRDRFRSMSQGSDTSAKNSALNQKPENTVKGRDVYYDQQLGRSSIGKANSGHSRSVATNILVGLTFVGSWLAFGWVQWLMSNSRWNNFVSQLSSFAKANNLSMDDAYQQILSQHPADVPPRPLNLLVELFIPTFPKLIVAAALAGVVWFCLELFMRRNLEAQNAIYDTSDINDWQNDQHIQQPLEVMSNYDVFPDVGAHSSVQVSSMISHVMLENKGIKPIDVTQHAEKDIKDDNGEVIYLKGEILEDDDGNELVKREPMFDHAFGQALFEASGTPVSFRIWEDPTAIPYNPGNANRDKLKGYDTWADVINGDWYLPDYEPQRPAGAYIVDTAPVNTMV